MAGPTLEILEPRHGQRFVEPGPVALRGRVAGPGAESLHVKWYSSIQASSSDTADAEVGGAEDAPLNGPGDDPLDFARVLRLGTHVLTMSAKDVPGDSPEDLEVVTVAAMAGGADPDGIPCVVTVVAAEIVEPAPGGGGLPPVLADPVRLAALAPARWGKANPEGDADDPSYVPDDDYHAHNTLRYRWLLVPAAGGEPAAEWTAGVEELDFDLDEPGGTAHEGPPRVRLEAPLPEGAASGAHTLVLRVEDIEDPEEWHSEDTMEVTVP